MLRVFEDSPFICVPYQTQEVSWGLPPSGCVSSLLLQIFRVPGSDIVSSKQRAHGASLLVSQTEPGMGAWDQGGNSLPD